MIYSKLNNRFVPLTIGTLAFASAIFYFSTNRAVINENKKIFIGDNTWIDLSISKIEDESHDTRKFTFNLPTKESELGLTLASALLTKFINKSGKPVIRPYTPISQLSRKGEFELLIKHYPDGKMSNHLFQLKPNDIVSFKGPIKKWEWEKNSFDTITLIGAGTGITPLYQLISHIIPNENDHTKVTLLYGNKSPNDILLKKQLDALQLKYPNKFNVTYFVDTKDDNDNDTFQIGFITKNFLNTHIAKPNENTKLFICGPPPFMKTFSGEKKSPADQGELTGILNELGYSADQVFKF